MKKTIVKVGAFLIMGILLLVGCNGTPSQPESAAPCLPGIAWGMTEDEVCTALGWKKEDVRIYDNETTGSYHIYGKEAAELYGVPCDIAFWESWDSGVTSVRMQFPKDKLDAALALMEEQGITMKEPASQPGVWVQQGQYLFQLCSEEEREEILQYQMRYWKAETDVDKLLEMGLYSTEEELIAAVEEDTREEIHDAVLYSVQIRPLEDGESCRLEMNGLYAAILNRIRAGK